MNTSGLPVIGLLFRVRFLFSACCLQGSPVFSLLFTGFTGNDGGENLARVPSASAFLPKQTHRKRSIQYAPDL
jgi:hypothetical protein